MRSIEASGKTREEAIQSGLNELGVEMYEVDRIEVLNEGSKGLFGFGARPVQVRLTVEKLPSLPTRPQRPEREDRPREEPRKEKPQRQEPRRDDPRRDEPRGDRKPQREPRREDNRPQRRDEPKAGRPAEPRREGAAPEGARAEGTEHGGKGRRRRGGRNGRDRDDRPRNDAPQQPRAASESQQRAPRRRDESEGGRPAPRREPAAGHEEVVFDPISDAQGNEAAALLQQIIEKMGIAAEVAFIRAADSGARLEVKSEDSALLIGRKGRTLSALQYIINRIITKGDTAENTERLVVDVEGYVDRRRELLESIARDFADKVRDTGRNFRLKPMSPQERRIIHVTLQEDPDVRTFSLGESLFRSVVISPRAGEGANVRGDSYRSGRPRGGRNRGGRGRYPAGRGGRHDGDVDAGAVSD